MIYALLLICSLHTVFAELRTLSEGEAIAFEAIFGTSDMKKLLEIERDPLAYWNEREKALKDKAIPHLEFCKRYTQEAQTFIEFCKKYSQEAQAFIRATEADKIWFFRDPNAIADTIKLKIPEDSPVYPTALAYYTALACDYIERPWDPETGNVSSKEALLADLDEFCTIEGLSDELNARMFWVIGGLAGLPIFDSLVLLSKKQYLCGATAYDKRMEFAAHRRPYKRPEFFGFNGPIPHDCLSHARKQYLLEYHLSRYGISYQDYFDQCWSKEKLIKNNLIELAQHALGCFMHFHEAPSVIDSWQDDRVSTLIFPKATELTDLGFRAIVPYFSEHATDHDWHESPIKPPAVLDHHATLCHFREKYCCQAGKMILEEYLLKIVPLPGGSDAYKRV